MGVRVNLTKRLVATASVALSAISLSGFAAAQASQLKNSATAQPSPTATHKASTKSFPRTLSTPLSSTTVQPVSGCVKTNSVPHYPMHVGTPNTNVTPTDRTFILNTNCGPITFTAFGKKAPITVIAMTFLAKAGFFDHSLCHRVTTSEFYILQCGDPTATGKGGPSFQYNDENKPTNAAVTYPAGTVAMANSGLDSLGRGTNSSQFFIVYKDSPTLPPDYSIWGQVTSGLDIVKRVAAAGVVGGGTDGTPVQKIAIESVTVK